MLTTSSPLFSWRLASAMAEHNKQEFNKAPRKALKHWSVYVDVSDFLFASLLFEGGKKRQKKLISFEFSQSRSTDQRHSDIAAVTTQPGSSSHQAPSRAARLLITSEKPTQCSCSSHSASSELQNIACLKPDFVTFQIYISCVSK